MSEHWQDLKRYTRDAISELTEVGTNSDARHFPLLLLLCSPKLIALDRSWFYCLHMTWVEPCDFMKE